MRILKRIAIAGVVVALLSAGAPAHASSMDKTAFTVRAVSLEQVGKPAWRRSKLRTWAGLGIIGAGVVLAFSGKKCGTSGALGLGYMQSDSSGSVSLSADGLEPAVAAGGQCVIEFTFTSRATVDGQDLIESGTVRLSRRSELDLGYLAGSEIPSEEQETILQAVIGSAAAVETRSRGRMAAGLGMAGAGILLATVFARTPVTVTRLDRAAVAVGTRLGW